MKHEEITDKYLIQLVGNVWKTDGDSNEYSFLLGNIIQKENPEPDLFFRDSKTDKFFITKYSLSSDGQSCFLTFFSNTFRIMSIKNTSDTHTMQLLDRDDNIIKYTSIPIHRI